MLLPSTFPLYPTPVLLLAFSFSSSVAEDTCDLVLVH